jgi:enoyl-CoA hydratase/carnithine racemase
MTIHYDVQDSIAQIRIDRPEKYNAMTLAMYENLGHAFERAGVDQAVRVVLLTGTGERAFCAGADLSESIPALAEGRFDISQWDGAHLKQGFYKPVVAAINGLCFGGGFEIMLATDIRFAAEDAMFSLPEPSMGFVPAGGTLVRLVRQVPYAFAMELMLTAERFTAARMAEVGVINRVVPREQLMETALACARRVAHMGAAAMRITKQAALTLGHLPLDEAFRAEAALGQITFTSPEAQAGLRRFAERKP